MPGPSSEHEDDTDPSSSETDCIHENLSSSKDHSQTAASMSVIALHIGILKEILSKPQVDFHEVGLALISACLALQIVTGLLVIYMHHIKSKSQSMCPKTPMKLNSGVDPTDLNSDKSLDCYDDLEDLLIDNIGELNQKEIIITLSDDSKPGESKSPSRQESLRQIRLRRRNLELRLFKLRKRTLLTRIMMLQSVATYLNYCVAVVSVFIVGFGFTQL